MNSFLYREMIDGCFKVSDTHISIFKSQIYKKNDSLQLYYKCDPKNHDQLCEANCHFPPVSCP